MGQVEVFQRHGANVVIVIDPVCVGMGVALFVRPCVRFEVVAALRHHRFRQNVLLFKEHLQRSLYLVHRPRPFVYGADNRQDVYKRQGEVLAHPPPGSSHYARSRRYSVVERINSSHIPRTFGRCFLTPYIKHFANIFSWTSNPAG